MAELALAQARLARLCLAGAWLVLGLFAASVPALAQPQAGLERAVKAAYLYKFAGFVEWPQLRQAQPGAVLTLGVAGDDALAFELARAVAGRQVSGRAIEVRRVGPGASADGLHILFLDSSLHARVFAGLLGAAQGQSVLTVSDAPGATGLGCMIGFVVANERLRFDVELAQVAPSGLRIGARMLAVANKVRAAS